MTDIKLNALRRPDTSVATEPAEVLQMTHEYFQKLATPVGTPKTGRYLPKEVPRMYPWIRPAAVDPFNLQQPHDIHCTEVGVAHNTIYSHIQDPTLFQDCLKHLSSGKAPGPDGIPNELLKHLPSELLDCIRHLMTQAWWLYRHEPNILKHSNTILLPKKDDQLLLANKRPIGLANTLHKLFTSIITEGLSWHAEQHQMLSSAQEGFRPYRNTIRQLQNYINVLEDAKHCDTSLYALWIDFSAAFNTVDHDKLLQIMYDMGFPTDAVEVVRDVYSNATTTVLTDVGPTAPINMDRGTIQGDTLSPFLFLEFIEPLLQWLQSGGRGHRFMCLPKQDRDANTLSSLAYADDLLAVTNTHKDIYTQALKIEQFSNWAGMRVNANKCAVSGILHSQAASHLVEHAAGKEAVSMLQRQLGGLQIQDQPIPFRHPDTEPYPYLGVEVSLTLNWKAQFQKMQAKLLEKGAALNASFASPRQQLQVLQQCIIPGLTYSLPIMPCTLNDIDRLDKIITRIAKRAYRLPVGTPNAMMHRDTLACGMGITSLHVAYTQLATQALTKALCDDGLLGRVTNRPLDLELELAAKLPSAQLTYESRYLTLAKQIIMAKHSGIKLVRPEGPILTTTAPLTALVNKLHTHRAHNNLGLTKSIPASAYLPLYELGITSLIDITMPGERYMMDTNTLQRVYGRWVKRRHKVALNRLTLYLNQPNNNGVDEPILTDPAHYHKVTPLPKPQRKITQTVHCTDLPTAQHMGKGAPRPRNTIVACFLAAARAETEEEPVPATHARPTKRRRKQRNPARPREANSDDNTTSSTTSADNTWCRKDALPETWTALHELFGKPVRTEGMATRSMGPAKPTAGTPNSKRRRVQAPSSLASTTQATTLAALPTPNTMPEASANDCREQFCAWAKQHKRNSTSPLPSLTKSDTMTIGFVKHIKYACTNPAILGVLYQGQERVTSLSGYRKLKTPEGDNQAAFVAKPRSSAIWRSANLAEQFCHRLLVLPRWQNLLKP